MLVSQIQGVSIHRGWSIYNRLFNHIEIMKTTLARKRTPWKVSIRSALQAAFEKLSYYYTRTENRTGVVYNIGCILDPTVKLTVYDMDDWTEETPSKESWKIFYKRQFIDFYKKKYYISSNFAETSRNIHFPEQPTNTMTAAEELEAELAPRPIHHTETRNKQTPYTEVHFYLEDKPEKLTNQSILDWWRVNEGRYPTIAKMAKYFLTVPIAGVGIECVFSMARDIVTYRRNRLKVITIYDLMIAKEN
jgi:hypothetical protein